MTVHEIKELLEATGNPCWSLYRIDRGARVPIAKFPITGGSKPDDPDSEASEKKVKAKVDMAESLRTLAKTTEIYNRDMPGVVFEITYSATPFSHSSGVHGPTQFTFDAPEPASVTEPVTQMGYPGWPIQQPAQPSFKDQFEQVVQLTGLLTRNDTSSQSGMAEIYKLELMKLEKAQSDLREERKQLRDQYEEKENRLRKELKAEYDERLERHKEHLQQQHSLQLGVVALEKKKAKAKRRQLEDAKQALESNSNKFAEKFAKTVEKAYDRWIDDGEDAAPESAALSGADPTPANPLALKVEKLAQMAFKHGDDQVVDLMGKTFIVATQRPELKPLINESLEHLYRQGLVGDADGKGEEDPE